MSFLVGHGQTHKQDLFMSGQGAQRLKLAVYTDVRSPQPFSLDTENNENKSDGYSGDDRHKTRPPPRQLPQVHRTA